MFYVCLIVLMLRFDVLVAVYLWMCLLVYCVGGLGPVLDVGSRALRFV